MIQFVDAGDFVRGDYKGYEAQDHAQAYLQKDAPGVEEIGLAQKEQAEGYGKGPELGTYMGVDVLNVAAVLAFYFHEKSRGKLAPCEGEENSVRDRGWVSRGGKIRKMTKAVKEAAFDTLPRLLCLLGLSPIEGAQEEVILHT